MVTKQLLSIDLSLEEGKIAPMNSMDHIIDECIYKGGNWMMYGCGKPNDDMIYKLTKINSQKWYESIQYSN